MKRKLKDAYKTGDLPEIYMTSVDVRNTQDMMDIEVLKLFAFLKNIGAGEIYTQVDKEEEESHNDEKPGKCNTCGRNSVNKLGLCKYCDYGKKQIQDDETVYLKGIHIVNRTGVYAFVFF